MEPCFDFGVMRDSLKLGKTHLNIFYRQQKKQGIKSCLAFFVGVPGGRDALRKHAGGMFLAKAGSNLRWRPGGVSGANREPSV